MKINRVNQDIEYKWNTLSVSPTSGNSPWLHAKSNQKMTRNRLNPSQINGKDP